MAKKKNNRNRTETPVQREQRPRPVNEARAPTSRYHTVGEPTKLRVASAPIRGFGLVSLPIDYMPKAAARIQSRQPVKAFTPKGTAIAEPRKKPEAKKAMLHAGNTKPDAHKKTDPAPQSPQAREDKTCKARPKGHNPRKPGGRKSKPWVPWC